MKKIILIICFFLSTFLSYSQCNNSNTPKESHLITNNLEDITIQLCQEDSIDLLIISQCYSRQSLIRPRFIRSADEGIFLLKNSRAALLTTDNSKFKLKFISEDTIHNPNEFGEICVYSYYEVTYVKLKYILLGGVENITVIKDDEIQNIRVSKTEAKEIYEMTFYFFKWMKWK